MRKGRLLRESPARRQLARAAHEECSKEEERTHFAVELHGQVEHGMEHHEGGVDKAERVGSRLSLQRAHPLELDDAAPLELRQRLGALVLLKARAEGDRLRLDRLVRRQPRACVVCRDRCFLPEVRGDHARLARDMADDGRRTLCEATHALPDVANAEEARRCSSSQVERWSRAQGARQSEMLGSNAHKGRGAHARGKRSPS